jgi:H+-transporting ATPase
MYSFEQDRNKHQRESTNNKVAQVLKDLNATKNGLTTEQAKERLEQYGPNTIPRETVSPFWQFLRTLWNPLSWVMEIAAIISIALQDYVDFALVVALLLCNSIIAFIESRQAGNAIDDLMKSLAPICLCYRDGKLDTKFNPEGLVPGDLISVRIGSIVPADCTLLEGDGLLCDQSSLTGESLPVERGIGEEVYSGSIVKRGESLAVVHATAEKTLFGKTAGLVSGESNTNGQFQQILSQVGWFCIALIAAGFVIELAVQFGARRKPCSNGNCETLSNALVLIVGGIPVAMPTVLSVTLAIGAHQLAQKDAIVSRLTAIEELSGMDVLCSDKTGTLTKNLLSVTNPISYNSKASGDDILFKAAISVPKDASDPIDTVLVSSLSDERKQEATQYSHVEYHPFHPIKKNHMGKNSRT